MVLTFQSKIQFSWGLKTGIQATALNTTPADERMWRGVTKKSI
jgi:hypothetical protein